MYLPLIFFVLSLIGIIIMIWRELILVRSGQITTTEHHLHSISLDPEKIKYSAIKFSKKFIYILLFVSIRSYILFTKFIKEKIKLFIQKLKKNLKKNVANIEEEIIQERKVSKYLKIISEYQEKIKKIKHQIKEEEGIE